MSKYMKYINKEEPIMLAPRKMQYDKAGPKVAEALNKRYF